MVLTLSCRCGLSASRTMVFINPCWYVHNEGPPSSPSCKWTIINRWGFQKHHGSFYRKPQLIIIKPCTVWNRFPHYKFRYVHNIIITSFQPSLLLVIPCWMGGVSWDADYHRRTCDLEGGDLSCIPPRQTEHNPAAYVIKIITLRLLLNTRYPKGGTKGTGNLPEIHCFLRMLIRTKRKFTW